VSEASIQRPKGVELVKVRLNIVQKLKVILINTNMKSFKDHYEQVEQTDESSLIEGINLRSISAIALIAKSNGLNKNIHNLKSSDSELDRKLNLLSKQILYSSILTAQLGLMNKRK